MHSQIVTNYDTTGRFFRGSFLDKLIFRGKNWPSRSFVVAMACSIVSHAKNRSSKVATEGRIAEFSPLKKENLAMTNEQALIYINTIQMWSIGVHVFLAD